MAFSKKVREQVYSKYDGRCAYCGKEIRLRDMQIDHFVPLMRGYGDKDAMRMGGRGTDDIDNLMPACRPCNFRKGMSGIDWFRKGLENGLNCCQRDFTYRMMVRYGLVVETPHPVKFYFEKVKEDENQDC